MAKQVDTVAIYLHIRRTDDGSYVKEIQRVSAVVTDPAPAKGVDKAPVVVENHDFGVPLDESKTVKEFFDAMLAAVSDKSGVKIFSDAVINRTTFQYLVNVDKSAYDSADWLISPDLKNVVGVDQKYWKVVGDTVVEMDNTEKAVVDASVLQAAIDSTVAAWTSEINKFVSTHYNLGQQQTMQTCWLEAITKSWPNRITMVLSVWEWVQSALDYFYKQRDAMWEAKSIDELNKIERDLSQFEATDPKVIVETVDRLTN